MLDKNRTFNPQNKMYDSDQNQKYFIYPQGAIALLPA